MSQPLQNHLTSVACLTDSTIGHAIRPSTYADDAEVSPRLEPMSKCMVMCFFGASRESYPICKLFFGKGYPLHYFLGQN